MSTNTIEVESLTVDAGSERLLGPVSFSVPAGDCLTIMGETGAGKSLLAQAILGILPHGLRAQGRIVLEGRRIDQLATKDRAKLWGRRMALLPQEPWRALNPLMRSGTQVMETHRFVASNSIKKARLATTVDLTALDLAKVRRQLPGTLSGGMAQRVAFAAARAGGAPLLIADEPTKGLDAARVQSVSDLLAGLPASGGALITITHEIDVARRLGGTVLILKEGALIEQGPAATVLTHPATAYGQALLAAAPEHWAWVPPVTQGEAVLRAETLQVARGGQRLIENFSLTLHRAERAAITGPSGSGKTSLLDVLAGLLPAEAGYVTRSAKTKPTDIQKIYQDPPAAFPPRIPLGRSLRDVTERHHVKWSVMLNLLERLKVPVNLLHRKPDAVSGGELQRIALARVLSISPTVLLADEPTSRLDPITQAQTMRLIAEVAAESKIAVVLVTHDEMIAKRWATRQIRLDSVGRSAESINN